MSITDFTEMDYDGGLYMPDASLGSIESSIIGFH